MASVWKGNEPDVLSRASSWRLWYVIKHHLMSTLWVEARGFRQTFPAKEQEQERSLT